MLYKVTDNDYKSIMVIGKYTMFYLPIEGRMINSNPNTLGIMLFETLGDAELFIINCVGASPCRVLTVEENSEIIRPEIICASIGEQCLDIFYDQRGAGISPPKGTVCCQAVKVIREIFP